MSEKTADMTVVGRRSFNNTPAHRADSTGTAVEIDRGVSMTGIVNRLPALAAVAVASIVILWLSWVQAPFSDEYAHLAAGCFSIEYLRFDLYPVNPPLSRTLAAVPPLMNGLVLSWEGLDLAPGRRSEWAVGLEIAQKNAATMRVHFLLARSATWGFWLLACHVIYRWARELYGAAAGCGAVLIWCALPETLTWSATICPATPAASMGVFALWRTRLWMEQLQWKHAVVAGLAVGLAIGTKLTWLMLFLIVPIIGISYRPVRSKTGVLQLILVGVAALNVVNSLYLYEGSFTQLGNFTFSSNAFSGRSLERGTHGKTENAVGNRFRGTVGEKIPVPLPAALVTGVDLQKADFEQTQWSYLRGRHKNGGWWYWYLYATGIKTPLGILLTGFVATIAAFFRCLRSELTQRQTLIRESAVLLVPAFAIMILVSSQTSFTHYLRYVAPASPFLCIWAGQAFSPDIVARSTIRRLCAACLMWAVASTLSSLPSPGSYTNELVGRREKAGEHLAWSAIDWNQDSYRLRDWLVEHPHCFPITIAVSHLSRPTLRLNSPGELPPDFPLVDASHNSRPPGRPIPEERWYAIGISRLKSPSGEFAFLDQFTPVETIGYSVLVYRLRRQDVELWRARNPEQE
ncbi:MAG: glycosyltransferase family 39 protein [Planctomycetaceae bacterium]|nr:glycosyltransferase family 39 protein [Planctomycetaceae bacterium]